MSFPVRLLTARWGRRSACRNFFHELLNLLRSLARELSDESAYSRHLKQTGRSHSAREWRTFMDGRYRRKYQNAKCC